MDGQDIQDVALLKRFIRRFRRLTQIIALRGIHMDGEDDPIRRQKDMEGTAGCCSTESILCWQIFKEVNG